jgi:hypothetical protein
MVVVAYEYTYDRPVRLPIESLDARESDSSAGYSIDELGMLWQ